MPLVPALLSLLLQASSPAAPAGAVVQYRARGGEQATGIAYFLADPRALDGVLRLNRLDRGDRLAKGRLVSVPRGLLRVVRTSAVVQAFRGPVQISGVARLRIGTRIGEGARITTGPDAAISLRMPDRTVVTLPSVSTLGIERLRYTRLAGTIDRRFSLEAGRSEYSVTPNHRVGNRFEIRTPVSVAAVRGTIFRVSLPAGGGANAEVLRGEVGVSGHGPAVDLPVGFGVHSNERSTGQPTRLLAPPRIARVGPGEDGGEAVTLDPVAGARRYRVQLARDDAFTTLLAEKETATSAVALPPSPYGTYYLRATALDAQGLEGLPDIVVYEHKAINAPFPQPQ